MTKKQKLIQEYISLVIKAHKDDAEFDLNQHIQYREDYLRNKKIADLEASVECVQNMIAKKEREEKIEAYFSTKDGALLKESLLTSIKRKEDKYENVINSNESTLIDKLQKKLGNHWTLKLSHGANRAAIEVGLKNTDPDRPHATFKFGHSFTIYIDKKWHSDKNYILEINYGCLGTFEPSKDKERVDYLMGLGSISGDSIFLEDVKETIIEMLEVCKEIGKEMSYYKDKLNNPFGE